MSSDLSPLDIRGGTFIAISAFRVVGGMSEPLQNADMFLYPAFSIAVKIRLFLTVTRTRYSLSGAWSKFFSCVIAVLYSKNVLSAYDCGKHFL